MALPPVEFSIVAGGVKEAQQALKSVTDSVRSMHQHVQQLNQQHSKKLIDEETKRAKEISGINQKYFSSLKSEAERWNRTESELLKKSVREHEQAARQIARIQQSQFPRGDQSNLGNIGPKTGKSAVGTGFIGGIAAGIGFRAVDEFFDKATFGFQMLLSQIQSGISEIGSAILQLGGFRGISDALVGGVKAQSTILEARMNVNPSERLPQDVLSTFISKMSTSSPFGKEEWSNALNLFAGQTGQMSPFLQQGDFLSRLSMTTGSRLEDTTRLMSNLMLQNPGMNQDQVQNVMLGALAQGRSKSGAIPFQSLAIDLPELTKFSPLMQGDPSTNVKKMIAFAQLARSGFGSVPESVTAAKAFMGQTIHLASTDPYAAKQFAIGFDKQGRISDPSKIIENAVIQYKKNPASLPPEFREMRSMSFIQSLAGKVEGDTEEEQRDALQKLINGQLEASESMANLKMESDQVADSLENKLLVAFNKIKDGIQTNLGPTIDQAVVGINKLINAGLVANSMDILKDSITALATIFKIMEPATYGTTQALLFAATTIAALNEMIEKIPGVSAIHPGSEEDWKSLGDNLTQMSVDLASAHNNLWNSGIMATGGGSPAGGSTHGFGYRGNRPDPGLAEWLDAHPDAVRGPTDEELRTGTYGGPHTQAIKDNTEALKNLSDKLPDHVPPAPNRSTAPLPYYVSAP